ncbi:MAG: biotin/lipoate A/B protein ligase family protein [Acidobacteriota bacterium]
MRIDEAFLRWAEKCAEKVTVVRFYRWAVPTLSLGKHQKLEQAIEPAYCQRAAIPVVHRATGGRAVFHADELTYAVASNDLDHFPLGSVRDTYRVIAAGLKEGLKRLGIIAQLADSVREPALPARLSWKNPCFLSPSRYELLLDGCKIVGSAQRRLKRSFLQHGSIPLRINYAQMAAALAVEQEVLRKSLISVSEASRGEVTFEILCEAIKEGFEQTFNVRLMVPAILGCDFSPKIASHQRDML